MIKIIGLGPGSKESITIGTISELEHCENIFLRTEIHPTVSYLKEKGIKFITYDNLYETESSFDDVYKHIAEDLICKEKELNNIIYAVPGHPLVAEKSVNNLIELCEKDGIEYEIVSAVSFIDVMMERLKIDPIQGLKIIDAFDINNQILDKRIGTIITQVYNNFIASDVKLRLLEYYDDETEILYVRAAGIKDQESIRRIPIYELDMQEDIDYLTSIYIPRDLSNKNDFNDLLEIVETLRGENGCPWDREQTHKSLEKDLIEECYEVIDAIDRTDDDGLVEELGDVLLHVIFHSSIGNEEGYFNISDVIDGICKKMVYRHPHVFKSGEQINDTNEVLVKWDELKKQEKHLNSFEDEIKNVGRGLPALLKAYKVQSKASKVIDREDSLNDVEIIISNINKAINNIAGVYKEKNVDIIENDIGYLLFNLINLSRILKVNPEITLNKFIDTFNDKLISDYKLDK